MRYPLSEKPVKAVKSSKGFTGRSACGNSNNLRIFSLSRYPSSPYHLGSFRLSSLTRKRGVWPESSLESRSAPNSSNNSTVSAWSLHAAWEIGVRPILSFASMLNPLNARRCVTASLPLSLKARYDSGVRPLLSCELTSTLPESTKSLMADILPPSAAYDNGVRPISSFESILRLSAAINSSTVGASSELKILYERNCPPTAWDNGVRPWWSFEIASTFPDASRSSQLLYNNFERRMTTMCDLLHLSRQRQLFQMQAESSQLLYNNFERRMTTVCDLLHLSRQRQLFQMQAGSSQLLYDSFERRMTTMCDLFIFLVSVNFSRCKQNHHNFCTIILSGVWQRCATFFIFLVSVDFVQREQIRNHGLVA